jgi:hypothetical protein
MLCVAVFVQVDPGLTGLALSYALSISGTLNWLVRGSTDTETYLASVERIMFYSNIAVEAPPVYNDNRCGDRDNCCRP